MVGSDELPAAARKKLVAFQAMIEQWRELMNTTEHTELAEQILDDSSYRDMWRNEKTADARGRYPCETRPRPFLLTGYGGFNAALTPSFSATYALWALLGGGVCVVNLRGGEEFGRDWHLAGKGPNKQNVFDDFTGAARELHARGWTSPAHLAINGGSNGGLLVAAASALSLAESK